MYPLIVIELKIWARKLARLFGGAFKTGKMGLICCKPSATFL